MSPRVAIVIPTWNRMDLLRECLLSLEAQTFRDFEIIVVDDASTDGTADAVRQGFPAVSVIRRETNGGFCAAVNTGIRAARAEYIMLLNNDMTLDAACMERLVARADVGAADLLAPLVVFRDSPSVVYGAGDLQRRNGRPESRGFRLPLGDASFSPEVFGVSAGAALYRSSVFETIGLFDERFTAYFEDSDINFRARLAGFRAQFVDDAYAIHVGSASLEGRTWWRTRQCYRNHALLLIKNMPIRLIAGNVLPIALELCRGAARVVSAARTEFGLARAVGVLLRVWGELLAALPHAFRERRRIQNHRVLSDADLDALLSPSEEGRP